MADDPRIRAVALAAIAADYEVPDTDFLEVGVLEAILLSAEREARIFLTRLDAAQRFPPPRGKPDPWD